MKKRLIILLTTTFMLLSGCGIKENSTVIFTTGWEADEVFYIEHSSCTLPEFMVYLANTKNQYKNSFGDEIFEIDNNGVTLEDTLKEQVLEKLASVKIMNLLAADKGIVLDEEELLKVQETAKKYEATLSENEKTELGVDYEKIEEMYKELALSKKVYDYLIADINPEISDDEARTITVQQIWVKTYFTNENGQKESLSDLSLKEAKQKITDAYNAIEEGQDFAAVALVYSDDETLNYSYGKGMTAPKYEEVAFSLSKGEISKVFETEDGFYILKCLTTFNKQETDRNKIKIVEQRRKEVFEEEYNKFTKTLIRNINTDLIEQITIPNSENVTTDSFFVLYETNLNQ